jgi:hypothetical protein
MIREAPDGSRYGPGMVSVFASVGVVVNLPECSMLLY